MKISLVVIIHWQIGHFLAYLKIKYKRGKRKGKIIEKEYYYLVPIKIHSRLV